MLVSVIMPVDRPGADADRAIAAVLAQAHRELELLLVGAAPPQNSDPRVRVLLEVDRNPALRRNRAAAAARGEILAFIDDDAFADPQWIAAAASIFEREASMLALGGPDPAPLDSPIPELISDLLLATPMIGSGIACHESRPQAFELRAPHDIALVNLFVRTEAFRRLGGFDQSIGYIGEDSELIARLIEQGRVVYSPAPVVFHRRRPFPWKFIAQRWRYRVKTGQMLLSAKGASYRKSTKLGAFLLAGVAFAGTLVFIPAVALVMLAAYGIMTLALAAPRSRLPKALLPMIPLFFLIHHAVYFIGIVAGIGKALIQRSAR